MYMYGTVKAYMKYLLCVSSIDMIVIAARSWFGTVSITITHTKIIFRLGPLFASRVIQGDKCFTSRFG